MVDNACIKNVSSSFMFVAMLRYSRAQLHWDGNTCQPVVYATYAFIHF